MILKMDLVNVKSVMSVMMMNNVLSVMSMIFLMTVMTLLKVISLNFMPLYSMIDISIIVMSIMAMLAVPDGREECDVFGFHCIFLRR